MQSRRRYLILLAAVLMQACLGATYSWSVFVSVLREHAGLQQATAQLPFTVFYAVFPATMVFSGIWLRWLGPRGCAMLGGLVFGSGWITAGFGAHHFGLTVLGIGAMGGIGVGLAYVVPIVVGMHWFPENKGLVTGVAVAGFGGGAACVSTLAENIMSDGGASPFETFQWFGIAFALLVAAAGSQMTCPPRGEEDAGRPVTGDSPPVINRRGILGDPVFGMLYLAMFIGLAAGFTVNANLKQLCPAIDSRSGAVAVALFALANAAGRVAWGFAFDRLLSSAAVRVNLLSQAVLLCASPLLIRSPRGLQFLAVIAGFNYGGVLVLYASSTARRWGADQVGRIYGWLFSANIPASLAPLLAGLIYDRVRTFTPALLTLAVLLVMVAVVTPRRVVPVGFRDHRVD